MQIKELFLKDINRRINPAVVASITEDEILQQEIEEYIFTPTITKEIHKFLHAVLLGQKGKTGVWINGYYGSGKSHFIKYLYFCLNREVYPMAFDRFADSIDALDVMDEPTLSQINTLRSRIDKSSFYIDLFNIDAVSGQGGNTAEADKSRITRILFNRLNSIRGYNNGNISLALYLEKILDKKDQFNSFKKNIEASIGEPWDGNQTMYVQSFLDEVISEAKLLVPKLDEDSLKRSITEDKDTSIEVFVKELQDFVSEKSDDYKLIFLMDEMSQYIGSNDNLLLNLQTIVEAVGDHCDNKVWIVCTAQQQLQDLMDYAGTSKDNVGKILGRFETRISLQGTDAAMITKKRILEKTAAATSDLHDYYKNNKIALENQFHFENHSYNNYKDHDDFILTYPFIPYQFELISDVFASFSNLGYINQGVKNTERAILGTTHATIKENQKHDVGYFVSFDRFFNEQLKQNLAHTATQIVSKALRLEKVESDEFAQRVVQALFMISHLGEQQALALPANAENLATLLTNDLNTAKSDLINEIQTILDYLESNYVIQLQDGKYRFLSDDEVLVAESIKQQSVSVDKRLDILWADIVRPILGSKTNVTYGNKNIKIQYRLDDKDIQTSSDFTTHILIYGESDPNKIMMGAQTLDLYIPFSQYISSDEKFRKELYEYVKTKDYINENSTSDDKRRKTLETFASYNNQRQKEIIKKLSDAFVELPIVSGQEVKTADQYSSLDPKRRFDDILTKHMAGLYRKNDLASSYASTNEELRAKAKAGTQTSMMLSPAEVEVESIINNKGITRVDDLCKQFEKIPFGWKDTSTIDVILTLIKKRQRYAEYQNKPVTATDFVERAINSASRKSLDLKKEESLDCAPCIEKINRALGTVVNTSIQDKYELQKEVKAGLSTTLTAVTKLTKEHPNELFANKLYDFKNRLTDMVQAATPDQLCTLVDQHHIELRSLKDTYETTQEFIDNNYDQFRKIRSWVQSHGHSLSSLEDVDPDMITRLKEYGMQESEPWNDFPTMRKAHKELEAKLNEALAKAKQAALDDYKAAAYRVKEEAEAKGASVVNLVNEPEIEAQINKVTSLDGLKLKRKNVATFEKEELQKLAPEEKSIVLETKTLMGTKVLSSDAQIDEYVEKLRSKLKAELSNVDKIIL
ncbi:MAG: hypothetical protein ACJATI_001026 [Halioglobus sp.]|jgi:hypothetical protein